MNAETLEALNASIAKWDRIAKSGNADSCIFGESCPLCHLFNDGGCEGCPVEVATGCDECLGSPWIDAKRARQGLTNGTGTVEDFRSAAAKEALFLRAIRPIGGV